MRSLGDPYKVLVDDAVVVDGGPLVILGVMPSSRKIVDTVRERLSVEDDPHP